MWVRNNKRGVTTRTQGRSLRSKKPPSPYNTLMVIVMGLKGVGRNYGIRNACIRIYLQIVLCTVGFAEMEVKINYFEEYNVNVYEEEGMPCGSTYSSSRTAPFDFWYVPRYFRQPDGIVIPPLRSSGPRFELEKKKRKGIYDRQDFNIIPMYRSLSSARTASIRISTDVRTRGYLPRWR